jgi:rhodanese-related sulfurtransferase
MRNDIIDPLEVRRLVDEGAQLVEVLPRDEYELWHLPGAISLPLRELDEQADRVLERDRPVIVYCNDAL